MKNKFSIAMSLAVVLAMLLTSFALADDISNNLDGTVDSTLEVLSLTTGGGNGTVGLFVREQNGDGKQGCNLTGSTTLVVSTNSSNTAVATVSPASVTFDSCGATRSLTITPGSAGTATISLTLVSNDTSGTFNLAPASFTVSVTTSTPSDTTPPTVTVTPDRAPDSNGWYNHAVTFTFTANEPATCDAPVTYSGPDSGSATVTGHCTDIAGNVGTGSITFKYDATAPVVTVTPDSGPDYGSWYNNSVHFTVSGEDDTSGVAGCDADFDYSTPDSATAQVNASCTDNAGNEGSTSYDFMYDGTLPEILYSIAPDRPASGWWNIASGAPTATFDCSDGTADIESCTAPYTFGEGENQTYTGEAKDNAGNTASVDVTDIDVDLTAPTITYVGRTAANGNGWNNGDVVVEWSCSDDGSGAVNASVFATVSTEGADQSATGTCEDLAGNTASDTQSGINIDKTAPVVAVTGVADGATYTLGFVPAAGCITSDALSGVATNASLSSTGGPVGDITATCSGASDKAGNTGAASVTYHVNYNWNGFFQPIDNLPTLNRVKAGSAIPVKFSLNGNQGLNIFAAGYPVSTVTACGTTATDDIESTVTAGSSSLTYDALANQYIYVWKTDKAWAGTCRTLTVKLIDGTLHQANFNFTR